MYMYHTHMGVLGVRLCAGTNVLVTFKPRATGFRIIKILKTILIVFAPEIDKTIKTMKIGWSHSR